MRNQSILPQVNLDSQPDPSPDADATLRAARNAVRSERARQARAAAWLCVYHIDDANDEATADAWRAERQRYILEAERLEGGR